MELLYKACSKCRRVLPARMFNKAKWLSSGLRPDCKDCYATAKRHYWLKKSDGPAAHRRRALAEAMMRGMRICRQCGREKPATVEFFAVAYEGRLHGTCRECAAARTRQWEKDNAYRRAVTAVEGCARRYASKRSRTPAWLTPVDFDEMRAVYNQARRAGQTVDHIIPLVGKVVSGLHVPWNLQILPKLENCQKSNRFAP